MKTTLHIGATKTGSTSIQNYLAINRPLLERHRFLYPETLGKSSHNVIPVYAAGTHRNSQLDRRLRIHSPEEYGRFQSTAPVRFATEVAEKEPEHIIISSEHMQSRLHSADHFERLRRLLAPALAGRELQIVVYLRPQIEHAISLYSTMLRHGSQLDIDSFIRGFMDRPRHRYFDFRRLLQTWGKEFPEARLAVRPFKAIQTLPDGVLADFSELTGLDRITEPLIRPVRRNESMGGWAAEALLLLNTQYSDLPTPVQKTLRAWIRHEIRGDGRVRPSRELARAFQKAFDKGNEWVTANYLPDTPEPLLPDWEGLEASDPPAPFRPDQFMTLIQHLRGAKEVLSPS